VKHATKQKCAQISVYRISQQIGMFEKFRGVHRSKDILFLIPYVLDRLATKSMDANRLNDKQMMVVGI
jgi:hypothetical protein